jgi:hypothetical protein
MAKNPWFHDVTPTEFKQYYEEKLDRIEELSGDCKRQGCDAYVEWPRQYCSTRCESYEMQKVMSEFFEDVREPTPPEKVPDWTPSEMKRRIQEFEEAL